MTFREILEAAVKMLSESTETGENADYEERAPYLLASACSECAEQDRLYRKATNQVDNTFGGSVCVSLDDDFPLCSVFAPGVTYYLAAMLVLDENEEMSDRFFSLFCDSLSRIKTTMPAKSESIADRYNLNL